MRIILRSFLGTRHWAVNFVLLWLLVGSPALSFAQESQVAPLLTDRDAVEAQVDLVLEPGSAPLRIATYNLKQDDVGIFAAAMLMQAAKSGTRVQLLIDQQGRLMGHTWSNRISPELLLLLIEAGVEVRFFHPLSDLANVNIRMHDKLVLRGKKGVFLDRNITKNYYAAAERGESDHHVQGRGFYVESAAAMADANLYYETLWQRAQPAQHPSWLNQPAYEILKAQVAQIQLQWSERGSQRRWRQRLVPAERVEFWGDQMDSSGRKLSSILDLLTREVMKLSRGSVVYTEQAYIVLNQKIIRFAELLRDLGLEFVGVTNSHQTTNQKIVADAMMVDLPEMARLGMNMSVKTSGSTWHGKLWRLAENIFIQSSSNLDGRSIDINSESGILVESRRLAEVWDQELNITTTRLLRNSTPVVRDGEVLPMLAPKSCQDIFAPATASLRMRAQTAIMRSQI